eukprot:TRINITY_DN10083_c0_g1_i10.p3 TRINITY_DN10083_c0_g1~~TRINITY_DN10083_c0_g1_i10.p3  ORF type:complete len:348 (+),score=48.51 TRINITY_DN10083_c0_g1_i10:115-1158(+)
MNSIVTGRTTQTVQSVSQLRSCICHSINPRKRLYSKKLQQLTQQQYRNISTQCEQQQPFEQPIGQDVNQKNLQFVEWYSELINKEILMFMMQQWYDIQLNRALNKEQYQLAQSVRDERAALDKYLEKYLIKKGPGGGGSSMEEVQQDFDVATRVLSLQAEMQRAVSEERYEDAAKLRDDIQQLGNTQNRESDKVALNAEWECVASPPKYKLGQRVCKSKGDTRSPKHCHKAVIVGWDRQCCESEEWAKQNKVSDLKAGCCQPFYHLLIDSGDWKINSPEIPPVAYVPEELLWSLEDTDFESWESYFGAELPKFEHPYSYNLFYGQDHNQDMVPIFPLKSKFGEQIED